VVDATLWDNYDDKYKSIGGQPPVRKNNVGSFFLLEYNAEKGRFEKIKD